MVISNTKLVNLFWILTFEPSQHQQCKRQLLSVQRQYATVRWQDRQQIYTGITAGGNAHCGQPVYNHAKQNNNKTNTKIENKETTTLLISFLICTIIMQSSTFPLPICTVSALGGEARFSPCLHPEYNRNEQTKQQEAEKKT